MNPERADSEVIKTIYERRSVRNFTEAPVDRRLIHGNSASCVLGSLGVEQPTLAFRHYLGPEFERRTRAADPLCCRSQECRRPDSCFPGQG